MNFRRQVHAALSRQTSAPRPLGWVIVGMDVNRFPTEIATGRYILDEEYAREVLADWQHPDFDGDLDGINPKALRLAAIYPMPDVTR